MPELTDAERRILDLATEDEYPIEQVVGYLEPLFPGLPAEQWRAKAFEAVINLTRRGLVALSGADEALPPPKPLDGLIHSWRGAKKGPVLVMATEAGERAYFGGDPQPGSEGGSASPRQAPTQPTRPKTRHRQGFDAHESEGWGRGAKLKLYRRAKGGSTWHFCPRCSRWPTTEYDEVRARPTGELCDECRARDAVGTCN